MKKQPRKKIYLAGGFSSGWQAEASAILLDYDILDPSSHNIENPKGYTEWDLAAITQCDVVLANMESTNPGGYALALEVGYAKALGKFIVLVDQIEDSKIKYFFEMVRQCSDVVFEKLPDALKYLEQPISGL